jgi:CHAT domain-containing protein
VQQGRPAALALQFEASDEAAITLVRAFYGAVTDRYPIGTALAEACEALFTVGKQVEWGTQGFYL